MEQKTEVGYQIFGLMSDNDDTKFKSVKQLTKDPPTILIFDENDNEFELELTKEMTETIAYDLEQIKKAYNGIPYYIPKDNTLKGRVKRFPQDIKRHPFIYSYIFSIITLLVVFKIITKFF